MAGEESKLTCTRPLIRSGIDCAEPLYGTWTMSMPAAFISCSVPACAVKFVVA